MTVLAKLTRLLDVRRLLMALVGIGILHICATLAAPDLATAPAHQRLKRQLPLNAMKVLPPVTAASQPLPFAGPDARYAMCLFDTAKSPVKLTASLVDVGWTLAIYNARGDSLYVAAGQPGQRTDVTVQLEPSGDRFTGLTPEARGLLPSEQQQALVLAARSGVAIVRATDRGIAFQERTEAILREARCAPVSR